VRALVTGGGGFLGGAIVDAALAAGWEVASISRGAYPALAERGIETFRADLGAAAHGGADADALAAACAGRDVVLHVAAKAGVWGPRAEYVRANVDGTHAVLAAARAAGVPRLVHTGSPSACFDGRSHVDAGADLPLASRFLTPYPETKAAAERLVRAANGAALATCVLRPHLIFGPGDPHLIPRLIERARARRLAIVGRGDNQVSVTYVDNAAAAHLDAARALAPDAPHAGRAYFVAQKEPVLLWRWVEEILEGVGAPPVRRRVPAALAYAAGAVLERVWRALDRTDEPPLTRFVARILATSHTYDLKPAERDFGYRQRVSLREATARTIAAFGG
jgi:nucleoside-diphosphate-sugar epimerase